MLLAGALQLVAGLLRLGQWFRAVSPAVVKGMLAGIGLMIAASQFHVMVDDRPRPTAWQNIVSIPESILKGLPLPAWEPKPLRTARIELLQTFGDLHERQDEIARGVARTVTRHGSQELHEWEQDHLADFDAPQRTLLADLRAAVTQASDSPTAAADTKSAKSLREALAAAERQMHAALDDLAARRLDASEKSQSRAVAALGEVLDRLKNHQWAAKIGVLSIGVILLWTGLAPGSWRRVPAPLLAVVVCTAAAWLFALPVLYVEVPDNLTHGLTFPSTTVLEDMPLRELLVSSMLVAVIASAATLLCATAIDQMHSGEATRYDRELAAQGVGNMICGALGALPMTGVIVRSAANVQAGARSRMSAVLHGLWLLVFVLVLTPVLRMIPTAALAGMLVYTGWKLINVGDFVRLWRESRAEAMIFVVTVVVIVAEDLLVGVVTGVVLSAVKLLVMFSRLDVSLGTFKSRDNEGDLLLSLTGAATFLRLPKLARRLEEVPPAATVHVNVARLHYIDRACLELLTNWADRHAAGGGSVLIDWEGLATRFKSGGTKALPADQPGESSQSHSSNPAA